MDLGSSADTGGSRFTVYVGVWRRRWFMRFKQCRFGPTAPACYRRAPARALSQSLSYCVLKAKISRHNVTFFELRRLK